VKLDLLQVCDLIHKIVDAVPSKGGTLIYHKTEANEEKTQFKIILEPNESEDLPPQPILFGGDPFNSPDLAVRSYWAIRCERSKFILNSLLMRVLESCREAGFKELHCYDTSVPLEDISLDLYHIKPDNRIELWDREKQLNVLDKDGIFHFVVRVGGYHIDITTAQFWLFDQWDRPLLFLPCKSFRKLIAPKSNVDITEKFICFLRDKMDMKYGVVIEKLRENVLLHLGIDV
jgi:hypothetical protein